MLPLLVITCIFLLIINVCEMLFALQVYLVWPDRRATYREAAEILISLLFTATAADDLHFLFGCFFTKSESLLCSCFGCLPRCFNLLSFLVFSIDSKCHIYQNKIIIFLLLTLRVIHVIDQLKVRAFWGGGYYRLLLLPSFETCSLQYSFCHISVFSRNQ